MILVDSDEIFVKGMKSLFGEKNIPLNKAVSNFDLIENEAANINILIGDPYKSNGLTPSVIKDLMTQNSNLRVLVITSIANKAKVDDVIDMGVHAVLFKCCKTDEFISAYYKAIKGECHYCSSILDKSTTRISNTSKFKGLTEREAEIAELIYQGKTTIEIADIISRSVHTVNSHRKNILKKLDIKKPLELLKLMSDVEL